MTILENTSIPPCDIADLREAVGWPRMQEDLSDPLMDSFCHLAIYEENRLIAYVDCVSNGVTDAYIQDLMVHPDYQGQGLGKKLMDRMIETLCGRGIFLVSVLYDESLRSYYRQFGFSELYAGQMELRKER